MLSQLVVNGFLAGSIYALAALGFALIYRVVRFFHFTYGFVYALGAYQAYLFQECCSAYLPISGLSAVIIAGLAGLSINALIFSPLVRRHASSLVAMLASLGIYVVGQNVVSILFGDQTLSIRGTHVEIGLDILDAHITPTQLLIVACCWVAIVSVIALLRATRLGAQIRAIANDSTLALIVGVPTTRITALSVALQGRAWQDSWLRLTATWFRRWGWGRY